MIPAADALFREIVDGGYARIAQFVADQQEEHLHLDFKQTSNRSVAIPGNDDKKTYSEALSGFANSDGGVLAWGVKAHRVNPGSPDVARELKPITGHRAFLTHLNSLASQLVARSVDGIQNHAIDDPADVATGFVIGLIPASDSAPHRAEASGIKRYFKRNVSNLVQMEHFDLEDMFGRRRRPLLCASCRFGIAASGGDIVQSVRARLLIENVGRHLAQHVGIHFSVRPNAHLSPGPRWSEIGQFSSRRNLKRIARSGLTSWRCRIQRLSSAR